MSRRASLLAMALSPEPQAPTHQPARASGRQPGACMAAARHCHRGLHGCSETLPQVQRQGTYSSASATRRSRQPLLVVSSVTRYCDPGCMPGALIARCALKEDMPGDSCSGTVAVQLLVLLLLLLPADSGLMSSMLDEARGCSGVPVTLMVSWAVMSRLLVRQSSTPVQRWG
jgi:hypothetical protein